MYLLESNFVPFYYLIPPFKFMIFTRFRVTYFCGKVEGDGSKWAFKIPYAGKTSWADE